MLNAIYHAIDPVAFSVGPFEVRWYGLAYIASFFICGYLMSRIARRWKLKLSGDDLYAVMIGLAFGVILGGRLGYCLFYSKGYYISHPLEIFMVNQGGMSFHGGLIGAFLGGLIAVRILHLSLGTICDLGAITAPLGLFLGRCANFINGELWGAPTDAPWGVVFGGAAGMMPRHPSQLYEAALEGLLLFALLYALSYRRPLLPQGFFMGLFLTGYGIIRFLLEFVREPDAHLGYLWGGWLTMGQILSVPLIIVGVIVTICALRVNIAQKGVTNEAK